MLYGISHDTQIPIFLRGGSIIPTKQRIRRSSSLTHNDPYTLLVMLDNEVYITMTTIPEYR